MSTWGHEPPIPEPDEDDVLTGPPGYQYVASERPRYRKCQSCRKVAVFTDSDGKDRCKHCKEVFNTGYEKMVNALPTIPDSPAEDA
jgi:hypothetical protein